jgi:hypothetical protein
VPYWQLSWQSNAQLHSSRSLWRQVLVLALALLLLHPSLLWLPAVQLEVRRVLWMW